jgi:hypothetical protein
MYEGTSGTSSSYYNFTKGDASNISAIDYIDTYDMEFRIDIVDTNSSVSSVEGPSLVYLYTIVPKGSIIDYITPKFQSEFESKYINNAGRPISSTENEVMEIDYNYGNDSYPLTMYKFRICNADISVEDNDQIPTKYGIELSSTVVFNKTYNSSFGFKSLPDDKNFELFLDQTDENDYFVAPGSNISDEMNLRLYNGEKFLKTWDEKATGYSNLDLGESYKIIVYSALNVSEGLGFTNIFWSTLQEVGIISSDEPLI